ncbi:MAG: carbohydrate kinase [Lachnospiraceae bacterium]|nr:carbohydrate kinase [Lachnospiraceae bacterium]
MKRYDAVALGELLIDFTSEGSGSMGNPLFEANPGGAPCNVLSMLSKLHRKTAFIGRVGNDMFGRQLKETLKLVNIDPVGLSFDDKVRTTLAFVSMTKDNDREFSFYRDPGADMMLSKEDVPLSLLKDTRLFHFGTLSMSSSLSKEATTTAVSHAREAGALISFDPNIRQALWEDKEMLRSAITYGLSVSDILKFSDDEIVWYTGEEDIDKAAEALKKETGAKLILLTLGKNGSVAYYNDSRVFSKAITCDEVIDATGAGDCFFGCCLDIVLEYGIDGLDDDRLLRMLSFANKAASIVITRKGALLSMPDVTPSDFF